jgi:hypothetical protein
MRETEILTTYYIINLMCPDIQRQVASRNEREENDISRWGFWNNSAEERRAEPAALCRIEVT